MFIVDSLTNLGPLDGLSVIGYFLIKILEIIFPP